MTEPTTPRPRQGRLFEVEPEEAAPEPEAAPAPTPALDPETVSKPVETFDSLRELFARVDWEQRQGRHRQSRELGLLAGSMFPRQLAAQLLSAESAVALGLQAEAEELLERARGLLTSATPANYRRAFAEIENTVGTLARRSGSSAPPPARRPGGRVPPSAVPRRKPRPAARQGPPRESTAGPPPAPAVTLPEVELHFDPPGIDLASARASDPVAALGDYRLRVQALAVRRLQSFETLLALGNVRGVDHYEYQLRTVTRVLREFFGRVLLADEVGLGKTVEACLCLKEYLLRGLVSRALILVPPSLRLQWRDELDSKFGIQAMVIDGDAARADPSLWNTGGVLIASLGLARLEPHHGRIAATTFDLVIVDEAHRLKNRQSRSWQLVDKLRSRFLLLLSATPVENDLIEIHNLLSLLKPGLFSTQAEFKRAFVGGSGRKVKDATRLRALLREVMIRNTRALAEAKLPPRYATTLRAVPGAAEADLYAGVLQAVRAAIAAGGLPRPLAGEILRAAGSSPAAAAGLLEGRVDAELAARARALQQPAKDAVLVDLLARRRGEKVLLFAAHIATLHHVAGVVASTGRKAVVFHGSLSPKDKERVVAEFAGSADVLVASESGGEGFNLQFAHTIVNYDLPWNPMRIEQRIGRVHRIGQTREVFIFNLVTAGTLEEEVLRVLDEKLNMFELVIGEVEMILGRLGDDEQEFQDLVLELYAGAGDDIELRRRFDELGERAAAAGSEHRAVQAFEAAAFGRDLEA